MLRDVFTDDIINHIKKKIEYCPYPKCSDRSKWDNINPTFKKLYIDAADSYMDYEFQGISAGTYLYTGKTDDLSKYNKIRSENMKPLYAMVIAECIENNGKYIEKIIDGIWSILDEATWHYPCPSAMYKRFPAVMVDVTDPLIELCSSQIAYNLAVIYYLLSEKLDKKSSSIYKRIYRELDRKIFTPYLNRKDYWWMAYERHYHKKMGVLYSINNFTPHCTNNVLEAFLLMEENPLRRSHAIEKTMEILDNYLNFIADDGWCDEGNGYWFMAYGSLNLVLDKIKENTNNYVDIFNNKKIYNMGQYLCNAHIGNGYFVNFADAHPINKLLNGKVIQYALNTKNKQLLKLAFEVSKKENFIDAFSKQIFSYENALFILFNIDKISNQYGVSLDYKDYISDEHYYVDSEVLIIREKNKSYKGLFLACKGGHNDENHNHNDAGNFIVYKDSIPILVDPGIETYISDTFNKNRYKLWTMQSKYHNLPTFNNVMQKETRMFRAKHVKYNNSISQPALSMTLKDAYEKESGLLKYNRTITFNRGAKNVTCNDEFILSKTSDDIEFSFITPCKTICNVNTIEFYNNNKIIARMTFDNTNLVYKEEEIKFRCAKLSDEWNNHLKRIILKVNKPLTELTSSFTIT